LTFRFLRQSLVTASVITIGANILSRLFGYVREAVIANYFGTSQIFDIFILAFTIPELIASVVFTTLPSALIPALKKIPRGSGDGDTEVFWSGLISLSVLFAAISILTFTFRGAIFDWLAPELSGEQFLRGRRLLAILSFFIFFRGCEAYFRSWLFEKKHFIVPAFSSILMNVIILVALFVLYNKVDIEALAVGWLAASVILFIYNFILVLYVIHLCHLPKMNWRWVKILLGSLLAVAVLESISMIYPTIDRYLAARWVGPGQIAALRYAGILIQIPVGIFVVAYNIVAFPWISDYSAPGKSEDLKRIYGESTGLIIFSIAFVALASVMFSDDIVRLAFQRGVFDMNSLNLTAGPFRLYALGIVFHSLYIFQMRFYYARSLLARLGVILFIKLLIKVVLSIFLVRVLEHNGLALSTSISWLCAFLILTLDLKMKMGIPFREFIGRTFLGIIPILCVVEVFWLVLTGLWQCGAGANLYELLLRLVLLLLSGGASYFALSLLMGMPQPRLILRIIAAQFGSRDNGNRDFPQV
jgi:putative peptidoglycan lipid II flippase